MLDYEYGYKIKGMKDIETAYANDYCNLTLVIYDGNLGTYCRHDCAFRKWCNSCARFMK